MSQGRSNVWKLRDIVNVKDPVYGVAAATLSARLTSAIAALPSTGGSIFVPSDSTGYTLDSTVTVNKPARVEFGDAEISCPAAGFGIDVTVNDCEIVGTKGTKFVMTAGGAGAIRNNQALRCTYRGFKIDPNNVQNQIAFHQDGGWYLCFENIEILKGTTHATTDSIKVQSTNTGVAGSTGSFGGAFVSTYDNVVAARVRIVGQSPTKVTTIGFKGLDAERVITSGGVFGLTFDKPVMQAVGGTFFDFGDDTADITLFGGDYEGVGTTIYAIAGSVRGIYSVNNAISGPGNTYFSGAGNILPAASYFYDDDGAVPVAGQFKGYTGTADWPLEFRTSGWVDRHRLGSSYSGDQIAFSANLKLVSATHGNLDNTASGGAVLLLTSSGTWKLMVATAGANPRTLATIVSGDTTGDLSFGQALNALGGGAAPTFGTIGGDGPTVAAQNKWLRLRDSAGAVMWVPVWK